jgi:hypothetical protein
MKKNMMNAFKVDWDTKIDEEFIPRPSGKITLAQMDYKYKCSQMITCGQMKRGQSTVEDLQARGECMEQDEIARILSGQPPARIDIRILMWKVTGHSGRLTWRA